MKMSGLKRNRWKGLTRAFELLTATFAADDFDLKHDWEMIKAEFKGYKLLTNVSNTDFIQAITLLATYYNRRRIAGDHL
jgi:hypothetical protein